MQEDKGDTNNLPAAFGIKPDELLRISQLSEDEQATEGLKLIENMLGFKVDPNNPEEMMLSIARLKRERDDYLRDCKIACRIALDLANVFGLVEADGNTFKQLEEDEYVACILKKLTKIIMVDAPKCQLPGEIGRKAKQKMQQEFLFIQAIAPMVGKYQPATREEMNAIISNVQL